MKLQRWVVPAGRLVRSCGVGLALLCLATLAQAQSTTQDFSATFSPGGDAPAILPWQGGSAPGGQIIDAFDGKAYALTQEVNDQQNGIAFNQVVSGPWTSIQWDFQMTISPGNGGGADGVGFAYAASDAFGADNSSPFPWTGGIGEEPNLGGSFGVGFDTFNNTDQGDGGENSVSLHWDGVRYDSIPIDGTDLNSFETGDIIQASIIATPVGNGSNVTVVLTDLDQGVTDIPFQDEFVDGFTPYDGRMVFRGRTGGANSEQVIDNISLTHESGAGTFNFTENFESYPEGPIEITQPPLPPLVGGTPFTPFQGGSDPGVKIINESGNQGAGPGHLQVTAPVNSQLNSIAFDKTSSTADNIQASFKFRIDDSGNNADGMSFLMLDANQYGDDGELTTGFSEDPNLAGALGVGFDTFNNDFGTSSDGCPVEGTVCEEPGNSTRRANHVSLHWDGAQVGENALFDPAQFDLVNNAWNEVNVLATQTDDGLVVTMTITDGTDGSVEVPFADVLIPGASFPNGARAAFGARTGGANSFQGIDDVLISWTGGGLVPGDFNGNGMLDSGDIDDLTMQSAMGTNPPLYDLTGDNLVNVDDVNYWISDLFKSYSGDLNLDKEFSSADLVDMLAAGTYETGQPSKWSTGDFNGDGLTNSGDLVTALAGGGYEQGPMQAVAAVPEPASLTLLLLGSLLLIRRRGR